MLKKIVIAFLVLIGLIVLNWWNVKQSEKKEAIKEQQELLLNIKKQNITKIAVSNSQGQWQLLKRSQEPGGKYSDDLAGFASEFDVQPQWLLKWDDNTYLANQNQVDVLLDDLTQAKKDKYIAKGNEKFSSYGIVKEKSEIKIYEGDLHELKETLLTGDLNTMGSSLYVANGNQDIFLSDQRLKDSQTKQTSDYIHKNMVGFDDPQKISLKNISGTYELIKKNDQWHISSPIKILADTLFVEGMLNHLKNFEIDEVLENREFSNLIKETLLKKADFFFEITDKTKVKKLYINESVPKGGSNTSYHAFIYRDGLPFVFKKSPIKPGHFYYTLRDLAVKKVFSVNASEVQNFKIIQNNKTKNFVQKDNQWIEEKSVGSSELNEFVPSHALFALKAKKFLKQDKNKNLTVDYAISVIDSNGQEQTLLVYKEPYKQNNLSFTQVYSSAHNAQLLFDIKQLDIISDAVNNVMNANKKESKK
ncbi:MAG TPA: DUF4340 domain-containing protein [Oligoflexia bacterium]|nr:DUF4340 domain-containing protein [Oligoflexia bacterium]HMR24399.1 DUF4340 domain-containing protein [Oligoflexia bacterium]